ncbi:Neuroligin-2 [Mactra antiquata]
MDVIKSLCLCLLYSGISCTHITVKTELGELIGENVQATFQGETLTVDRYLGVPYAQPPVGELRFQKPLPAKPFETPFDATKYGAMCPQFDLVLKGPAQFDQSEDCLFMNIYVPNQKPDKDSGHSVMFFIHGGGFSMGTGNIYRGEVLSAFSNVIVVTINYRIGLLGFLDLNDDRARGNFGLWDQRQALLWVNKHIKSFGGDKDRVTIFGESAGATSVTAQMLYPPNKGLFQNAIAESGSVTMAFLFPDDTMMGAVSFAEAAECSSESTDDLLKCFMEMSGDKPTELIADAVTKDGLKATQRFSIIPTVDGEFFKLKPSTLMKLSLEETVEEIEFARTINFINGINEAEGAISLMMLGTPEEVENLQISREQMNDELIPLAFAFGFGFGRTLPEVVKKILVSEYTDWTGPNDPFKLRDQFIRLNGDIYFNAPGIAFSLLHANGTDESSYVYMFSAVVDLQTLPTPSWFNKANHGDEVAAVFGYNFDLLMIMNMTEYEVPSSELDLSARMMTYWSNFAKSGNPNLPIASKQSIESWPKYNVEEQRYKVLDYEESNGQFLFAHETDLWTNILPAVLDVSEKASEKKSMYSEDQKVCEKDGEC